MKKIFFLIIAITSIFLGVSASADFEEDTVLVKMKAGGITLFSAGDETDIFDNLETGIAQTEEIALPKKKGVSLFSESEGTLYMLTLENSGKENVLSAVEELESLDSVEYAEPNYIYYLFDTEVNDKYYSDQYSLKKVGAPKVWDFDIDCSSVVVGVIDTGANLTHEDLADNIWVNQDEKANGRDTDKNGYKDDINGYDFYDKDDDPTDENGHGTHVAGIVGAATNNSLGVASLSRNVKIAPLKVFSKDGKTNAATLVNAIAYAYNMDFPIVNMSLGTDEDSTTFKNTIKNCPDMLFVVAAGNASSDQFPERDNETTPIYPASYDFDNIIAVAATDENDNLASFSHYGITSVDIAAPGYAIKSTLYDGTYGSMSGTSMACPLVTSAAAVLKAQNPDMTAQEIIQRLEETADPIESLGGYIKTGARLNAYAAAAPDPTPTPEPTPSPTPTPTPTPVIECDVSFAETEDNKIRAELTLDGIDVGDIWAAAAYKNTESGVLEKALIISWNDEMSAVLDAPAEGCEVIFYIWNKDMKPLSADAFSADRSIN